MTRDDAEDFERADSKVGRPRARAPPALLDLKRRRTNNGAAIHRRGREKQCVE